MSVRFSQFEYDNIVAARRTKDRNVLAHDATPTDEPESKLHERIMEHCDAQWPRWKYIHARMDQRSTIAVGAPDFVIFLPAGRVLCVECKAKGKKRTPEQLAWAMQMEQLGHTVYLVESWEQFLPLI